MIWDGSPILRRVEVQEFVEGACDAIHLAPLPPDAPALNPVEWAMAASQVGRDGQPDLLRP